MKTLQVNAGNEAGGGRTLIINLLQALNEQGVDSQLLVFERGPVSDLAQKHQIPTTIMNQNGRWDLSVAKRLKKFIRDNNIDVVNTHGPRANFIMSLIHRQVSAKWVVTVHSNPHIDFAPNLVGKLLKALNVHSLKRPDLLMLVTPQFQPILEDLGIAPAKMKSIFNAIYFNDSPPETTRQKVYTIVNIASLIPVKNQQALLRALARVPFDYHLQIVGDGPLRAQLEKLADQLQIANKVEFSGFQDDTSAYYTHADVFVLPSVSEGFPMVLLESANHALPMIVADTGSDAQVVHSDTGWVVEPDNLSQLQSAIEAAYQLWQQDQLRSLGQKFFFYCKKNFSSARLAKTVINIYQNLIR